MPDRTRVRPLHCGRTPAAGALIVGLALSAAAGTGAARLLFHDDFRRPDGLVTNEFAHWKPRAPGAVHSPDWDLDSGSLFIHDHAGWTGEPDDLAPDAASAKGTHSAVFRLTTKRTDFSDVAVRFELLNEGLSAARPPNDWDGCHVFLRYQSEYHLYYASINRRDNTVVLKKKIPGGPSNGGTYYYLAKPRPHKVPYGEWQKVEAVVRNDGPNAVRIALYADGRELVSAVDNGSVGGAPIFAAGRVGLRADNAKIRFRDFKVYSADP